ncbi:hypothetical protein Mal52_37120 [Symmachiella dynata]|uniref:Uncharacterized protein n=1 Tax=Symmachiella dynata TaxID=2527995 RepID=A0A517ZRV2_9PLAN|nr:hypothetical protein [Symmachiella dynata]QDU45221.1 hypothetical protein Mal52_37120 [Symmachiella dynata]
MNELKRIFFDAYGGFADKRLKNLEKGSTFIVDDRDDRDNGADRKLYSYFCMIFADVTANTKITVTLSGNVPKGKRVRAWLKTNRLEINSSGFQSRLVFSVSDGGQSILGDLADAIESIVAPSAQRYSVANYKYVCPRTATSLRRLKKLLDGAWDTPLPDDKKGFFA